MLLSPHVSFIMARGAKGERVRQYNPVEDPESDGAGDDETEWEVAKHICATLAHIHTVKGGVEPSEPGRAPRSSR